MGWYCTRTRVVVLTHFISAGATGVLFFRVSSTPVVSEDVRHDNIMSPLSRILFIIKCNGWCSTVKMNKCLCLTVHTTDENYAKLPRNGTSWIDNVESLHNLFSSAPIVLCRFLVNLCAGGKYDQQMSRIVKTLPGSEPTFEWSENRAQSFIYILCRWALEAHLVRLITMQRLYLRMCHDNAIAPQ